MTKRKPARKIPLRHRPWDHLCICIEDGVRQGHLWLHNEDYPGDIEDRKRGAVVAVAVLRALAERFHLTPEAIDAAMYGAMGGWNRAHKHMDDPSDSQVQEAERQYIESGLAELLPEEDGK